MHIRHDDAPIAGRRFKVEVNDYEGMARLTIFVGRSQLLRQESSDAIYADPWIPANAAGSTLMIVAEGRAGRQTVSLEIG